MASKVLVDPSELSCSVCLDVFTDPRVLPCIHTYCYGCLEGWMNKSGSSQTITCPLCQDVSPIPSGGLNNIKSNFFLADLVERINKMDLQSSQSRGVENVKESIQLHEAVPIIYCKSHSTNTIDQYCVDCDLPACGTCLLRDHRHHNLVDLEEQAKISKQQLEDVLKQTDVLIELIDEQIKDSEKHEKQSTDDINGVKHQINKVIDDRISKLDQRRQQLINSLDKIREHKEKVIMTVHDGQATSKAAVTSLRSYSDNMLRHGRDFDMIQQAGDIQSRLASVYKTEIPLFIWSRHDDQAATPIGEMAVAKVSMTTDVMDTEAVDRRVRGSGAGSVRDNVVSKIPMIGRGGVAGLAVMNQTVWVVHRGWSYEQVQTMMFHAQHAQDMAIPVGRVAQSCLYAYPVTSPSQPQTLAINKLSDPRDMVRFPPGQSQLVIGDRDNKQLQFIKLDQRDGVWKVTSQTSVNVGYCQLGLGVHGNQLLVCDRDDNVIHVFSRSGEETHRVNMSQGVRPWKAVPQLTSPGFVILDCNNKEVVLMTEKGEVQHKYWGQEGFRPGDIVCHGHSIYVTDCHNNLVDELSVDGHHVRQLITEEDVRRPGIISFLFSQQGEKQPDRMCVDDTGRLYVAKSESGKHEVWVIESAVTPTDTQATPDDRIITQQTNMNLSVTWCD